MWIDLEPNMRSVILCHKALEKHGDVIPVSIEGTEYPGPFLIPQTSLSPEYVSLGAAMILQLTAYRVALSKGLNPGDMRYCDWVIK